MLSSMRAPEFPGKPTERGMCATRLHKFKSAIDSRQGHKSSPWLRDIKDGLAGLKNTSLIIRLVLIALPEVKVNKERKKYPALAEINDSGPVNPQSKRRQLARELALSQEEQGIWKAASKAWQRLLDIEIRELKADHPFISNTYMKLADCEDRQGNPTKAAIWREKELAGLPLAVARVEKQLDGSGVKDCDVSGLHSVVSTILRLTPDDRDKAEALLRRWLGLHEEKSRPDDVEVANILYTLGVLVREAGRLDEAEELLRRCLKIKDAKLDPDDPGVAHTLDFLGVCVRQMGRLEEAEELLRRGLGIKETKLGPEDVQVAYTLHELGVVVRDMGRLEEAEELLQRCMGIKETRLGPHDVQVAYTLHVLGACVRDAGRPDEAEGLLTRCLNIKQTKLGTTDMSVAITLYNLGVWVREAGRLEEAEELFRRCLSIEEAKLGPEDVQVAYTLHDLGVCVRQMGRLEEAEGLLRRGLGVKEAKLGPKDMQVAYTLHELGGCLQDMERLGEAERLLWRCLNIKETKLGTTDMSVAITLHDLGVLIREVGRLGEAEELFMRCLEIEEAKLGPEDVQVAYTLHALGACVGQIGRLEEAEKLLTRGLEIKEAKLGQKDMQVAYTLHELGACLQDMERPEEAEGLLRRCLGIKETELGPEDVQVSHTLFALSGCVDDAGRQEEAEGLLRRCLEIEEAKLDPEDMQVAYTLHELGVVVREMGRLEEAEGLLRRCKGIKETKLGPEDLEMAYTLLSLGICLKKLVRLEEAESLFRRCLLICEAKYGPKHEAVCPVLHYLGVCVREAGRLTEAEKLWTRCLVTVEANMPPEGANVSKTSRQLGWLEKGKKVLMRYLAIEEAEEGGGGTAADGALQEMDAWVRKARWPVVPTESSRSCAGTNDVKPDPANEQRKPSDADGEEWEVLAEELRAGEEYQSKEGGVRLRVQRESLYRPGTGPIKLHHYVQLLQSNDQHYCTSTVIQCPANVRFRDPLLLDFSLDVPNVRSGEGALREVLDTYQILRKSEDDPRWEPMEDENMELVEDSDMIYLRARVHHFTWFCCGRTSDVRYGIERWNHKDQWALEVENESDKTLLVVTKPSGFSAARDGRHAINFSLGIAGSELGGGFEREERTEYVSYPSSEAPTCNLIGPRATGRVGLREKICRERLLLCTIEDEHPSSGKLPVAPSSTGQVTPASEADIASDQGEFDIVRLYSNQFIGGGVGITFHSKMLHGRCLKFCRVRKNTTLLEHVAMALAGQHNGQPRQAIGTARFSFWRALFGGRFG